MYYPQTAIIITCYNYGLYLEQALQSAIDQTYKNAEILVVDDGSNDPYTIQKLDELSKTFGHVKFLKQANGGPASARNLGIENTQAEVILMLDGDDWIAKDLLSKAIEILERDSNASPLYSDVSYFGDRSYLEISKEWDKKTLLQSNFIVSCPIFFRSAWQRIGGYDSASESYEDYEFYINLAQNGYIGKRIEGYLLHKRWHSNATFVNYNTISKHKEYKALRYIRLKHKVNFKYLIKSIVYRLLKIAY